MISLCNCAVDGKLRKLNPAVYYSQSLTSDHIKSNTQLVTESGAFTSIIITKNRSLSQTANLTDMAEQQQSFYSHYPTPNISIHKLTVFRDLVNFKILKPVNRILHRAYQTLCGKGALTRTHRTKIYKSVNGSRITRLNLLAGLKFQKASRQKCT